MESTPPPPHFAAAPLPGDPHPALFHALLRFRLPELLTVRQVCRSLRNAVAGDPLLWRELVVVPPLSARLTDNVLCELTSGAAGKLRSLGLFGCVRVTDVGLRKVVDANPLITKLSVPECFHLTADCTVDLVRSLARTNGLGFLERIWLHGISNTTKEHLDVLNSLIQGSTTDRGSWQFFYPQWHSSHLRDDRDHPIDIQLCPKCDTVRMVFDCTREDCKSMKNRLTECRGCFFCIPRCEDCGACLGWDHEEQETVCLHLLCLQCWLLRPKCENCNRPYCKRDWDSLAEGARSAGFICDECSECWSYDEL